MKRIEAIKKIMFNVDKEDIVITSPGMISREVYAVKDRNLNFYLMGSMGATVSVGTGLAISSNRFVYVITGDGDVLMNLENLVLLNKLKLPNIRVYILDNGEYATTGGQKTLSDSVDFESLYENCQVIKVESGKGDSPRIPLKHELIKKRFMKVMKEVKN